jgi:iron(III) transport system permease protein
MKRRAAILITSLTVLWFAVFFLYPAGMVVKQAFEGTRADGSTYLTLDYFGAVISNPIYREGLVNALLLGLASTAVTLLIAMPLALVAHRFDFPGKRWLGSLVLVPMILPPFVGAVGIKQMLGVNGALNALLI